MSHQPMTARDKMQKAKQLIEAKRYDEARTILNTVNHPLAQEWLGKLNQTSKPKSSSRRNILIVSIVFILGLAVIGIGVYIYSIKQNSDKAVTEMQATFASEQGVSVLVSACRRISKLTTDQCKNFAGSAYPIHAKVVNDCSAQHDPIRDSSQFDACLADRNVSFP